MGEGGNREYDLKRFDNITSMPPKKKEEEIDLSTLPELKTLTALILIRGKKTRAQQLLQRIYKEADKTMGRIKRS